MSDSTVQVGVISISQVMNPSKFSLSTHCYGNPGTIWRIVFGATWTVKLFFVTSFLRLKKAVWHDPVVTKSLVWDME